MRVFIEISAGIIALWILAHLAIGFVRRWLFLAGRERRASQRLTGYGVTIYFLPAPRADDHAAEVEAEARAFWRNN